MLQTLINATNLVYDNINKVRISIRSSAIFLLNPLSCLRFPKKHRRSGDRNVSLIAIGYILKPPRESKHDDKAFRLSLHRRRLLLRISLQVKEYYRLLDPADILCHPSARDVNMVH